MADSSWLGRFSGPAGGPLTTRQIYQAFVLLGYDFGYDEAREGALEYLAAFTQRWGKPSSANLLAIAHRFAPGHPRSAAEVETNDDADETSMWHPTMADIALVGPDTDEEADTTFALAVLGTMRIPEASSALLPYLTSAYAEERWQAAFGLAALHDERALPTLGRMLVEFIGPNQPEASDGPLVFHFQLLRSYLPRVLSDWGNPRLVPLLRAALIATVRAEEIELQEPHGPEQVFVSGGRRLVGEEARELFHYERRQWVEEEHRLVYALGRLGAFGALTGVPTRSGIYYYWEPSTVYMGEETGESAVATESSDLGDRVAESRAAEFRGAVWRVHACCGFLEPQFRDRLKGVTSFTDAPEFVVAIERLLEGQFGWDAAERRQALEDYERASFLTGTVADYERFARQAQEETEDETEDETEHTKNE